MNVCITVAVIRKHKQHHSQEQKQSWAHVVFVLSDASRKSSPTCALVAVLDQIKCVFLCALLIKNGDDFWNGICDTFTVGDRE